jgi:predicted AAA+ superfamily ATPase
MIERSKYINKVKPFMDKPVIKVITGIRRCGKSTLLTQLIKLLESQQIQKNQLIYINKELFEFDAIQNYKQLYEHIKNSIDDSSKKHYIFIDEIQEIESWERTINSLLAEGNFDIYVTGSNARLLSSEIATLLSGRYVEFKVQTLSFSEFKIILNSKTQTHQNSDFELYLKYGGFPGIHHMELDDSVIKQYLQSIYSTVLLKDVIVRNNLRDAAMLDAIGKYLVDNCGNITTAKSISDYMKSQQRKVSVDTVLNYIQYSCDALIFEKINRFDVKGKRLLETFEKYYMADIGFRFAKLGYTPQAISGQLENIVLLELQARDYLVTIGKVDEKEIDFIATKGNEKIYIQVCTTLADQKVIDREYASLEAVDDHFPKYVLSLDSGFETHSSGIKWMNIEEFLLATSW